MCAFCLNEIRFYNKLNLVPWVLIKPEKLKGTIWESLNDTGLKLELNFLEEKFKKPEVKPVSL